MTNRLVLAAASLLALGAASAHAQSTVVVTETQVPVVTQKDDAGGELAGATTGAVGGAIVGGPVGAVVGGVAGLVTGALIDPPETELTYVRANKVEPVVLEGQVQAGTLVPNTVVLTEIPQSQYRYVYVNGQAVLVDPATRQVVYVER